MSTQAFYPQLFSRRIPWRLVGYIVVLLIALAVASPILWMAHQSRLKSRYEYALNRLQVGDSEQTVIALMGQPNDRNWCLPLPKEHESKEMKHFHDQCFITYTYVTFMVHYTISLDKDNRVSGKHRSVSP